MASVVKNPPANAGNIKHTGSVPQSARTPRGGNGNSLQYSCLEKPIERGAWRVMVHRVAKSWTPLKHLSTHTHRAKTQGACAQWLNCVQLFATP